MDCKIIVKSSSSSSSSSRMIWKYDAFVSFRGEDTRNNFTDHLFGALRRKGIHTFRDDTNLKKGESIAPELHQAIEESQVLIVVFSKNYASSTWCLQELAKIVDCIDVRGQRKILPIFYDVNPSEVRKQSGGYGEAFAKLEERFKDDEEKMKEVQRWREALKQMGNLSGWDVSNKPQYVEIEKIVEKIISILGQKNSSLPSDLVGVRSQLEKLERLLHLDSVDEVRVIGICGMGGIGKTTLAKALFDRISDLYNASYFIDVSKIYRDYDPISPQKQLTCQTLSEDIFQVCNLTNAANLVRNRLHHLRSLIVVDNVYKVEELEKLAVKREWVGAGSRIIIISRDEHILKEYGVDAVFNVQHLNFDDSCQLFFRKAFKCEDIMMEYKELTYEAIHYAKGLPLALKMLGSSLFGRNVSQWKSALARLRENPTNDIMDVLRISFDGLEEMEKEIFLDIACFFCGEEETHVKEILDIRGFFSEIGLSVLIDRSLITSENGFIYMHGMLKQLGRSIVRGKSPKEPWKWSRLWKYKDLHNVMLKNKTAKNLEAIVVEHAFYKMRETTMRADALSKMNHLKLLIINNVNFSGRLDHLSNELRYLCWHEYPFTCLPSSFQPDRLVQLILYKSNIKQLWEGTKALPNLTYLSLSTSRNLIKMPDLREAPNLEGLNLEGCIKLVQIDPSIGFLRKLTILNMENCINLVKIPNSIMGLSSLEVLNLSGCSKLLSDQLLEKASHVKRLKMSDTSETAMDCQFFYSRRHEGFVRLLLLSLPSFPCLRDLNLSFCNLLQIPDVIGSLCCLETLNLGGNNFVTLPSTIKELSSLVKLNVEHCKQLKYLPELPSHLILPIGRVLGARPEESRHVGIYIFNCPKLIEMEQCSIIALAWMIRVIEMHEKSILSFCHYEAVIPGGQIPFWFKNKIVGSSITVDPSPVLDDNNWIGIACYVAFQAYDQSNSHGGYPPWQPNLMCGFAAGSVTKYSLCIPVILRSDLVTVESDHLWLLYCTKEQFIDSMEFFEFDDIIEFSTSIYDPPGLHLEVNSCGFRWVFKQDLEQLNAGKMHNKSGSSTQNDDNLNLSVQEMQVFHRR